MDETALNLNFNNICRCCLGETDVRNIFQELIIDGERINLQEIITFVTCLELSVDDSLPHNICIKCIGDIYTSYKCKQLWIKSDETLKCYLELTNTGIVMFGEDDPITDEYDADSKELLPTDDEIDDTHQDTLLTDNDDDKTDIIPEENIKKEKTKQNNETKNKLPHCERCQIYFATWDDFFDHKKRIRHPRERKHQCPLCGKYFASFPLKTHMRSHTKEKPYSCSYCDATFSLNANLRRHIKIHTGERPHKCEFCNKAFIQSTSLKDHIRTHTGEMPFVCNICGKKYAQSAPLKAHIAKHNLEDGKVGDGSQFACDVCDRVFATKPSLKQHKLIHGEKKYLCSDCGKGFFTPGALLSHSKRHTGVKPYKCKICDKSFTQIGSLKTHLYIHTGVKPYVCNTCGKSFTQRNHLVYHARVHTGEKPYQCSECGKCFSLNGTLTVHMRMHTGETPYLCPICGKGFYDSSSMKRHKKANHDDKTADEINHLEDVDINYMNDIDNINSLDGIDDKDETSP